MTALDERWRPHVAITHAVEIPLVGVRTTFETNDARVAAAIADSFGAWCGTDSGESDAAGERLAVRVLVVPGDEGASPGHAPVRHHVPDAERVIVRSPGSVGIADSRRREAIAWITGALVDDCRHFRAAVLEALTLALVTGVDRHPLHAAAVAQGERALLLAGASGAGKSTLTLAALQAGLDVVSEDRVWIQLAPRLRVWGWHGELRLVDASSTLGTTADAAPSTRDGKTKLGIALADAGRWRRRAERARVCVVERERAARPRVEPLTADEVRDALSRDVAPGFDRFPARHARVVDALAERGGWRLVPSLDARESVPLLREMLGSA